jgi:hypothetical protein
MDYVLEQRDEPASIFSQDNVLSDLNVAMLHYAVHGQRRSAQIAVAAERIVATDGAILEEWRRQYEAEHRPPEASAWARITGRIATALRRLSGGSFDNESPLETEALPPPQH